MGSITSFQIGKAGITQGVIASLDSLFKNHYQIRISLLKSSGRNTGNIKSIAEDICFRLPIEKDKSYSYRIIGFKIIIIKHSKLKK